MDYVVSLSANELQDLHVGNRWSATLTRRCVATDDAIERMALALWERGNERVGHRDWEAVADEYRIDARRAYDALSQA